MDGIDTYPEAAKQSREETAWEAANARLAKAVSGIENGIEHLEARLEGILNPGIQSDPENVSMPEEVASPVVNTTRDHAAKLDRLSRRLSALRERVEV